MTTWRRTDPTSSALARWYSIESRPDLSARYSDVDNFEGCHSAPYYYPHLYTSPAQAPPHVVGRRTHERSLGCLKDQVVWSVYYRSLRMFGEVIAKVTFPDPHPSQLC